MGRTYSITIHKVKTSAQGKNPQGFRYVRSRRYLKKKSIPRVRNTKNKKFTPRSEFALSIKK